MVTVQAVVSTACGGMSALVEDLVVSKAHRGKGRFERPLLLSTSSSQQLVAYHRRLGKWAALLQP